MLVFFPRQARPRVVRTGRPCWHPPMRWPPGPLRLICDVRFGGSKVSSIRNRSLDGSQDE
jgi:hypothetical protein